MASVIIRRAVIAQLGPVLKGQTGIGMKEPDDPADLHAAFQVFLGQMLCRPKGP